MTNSPAIPHSQPWITPEDIAAVSATLRSGMIACGGLVREFEQAVAGYLGVDEAVATSSGTAALTLALLALELPPKSEILLPTYVCQSVWSAVVAAGLQPRLCDAGPEWRMTADGVRGAITAHTRGIIAVHTFGAAVDVEALVEFGVPVIVDACQAFGLRRPVLPTPGASLGVLSFQATKCLTTGEGGMVVARERGAAQRVRGLRDGTWGCTHPFPARMSDLQAALGLSQLARYDEFLRRREALASRYLHELDDIDADLPTALVGQSMFFRFPLRTSRSFDELRRRFADRGVHVRRGVDQLLHHLLPVAPDPFPCAERLFAETVSIPLYPALTDEQAEQVIAAARDILKRGERDASIDG